MILNFHSYRSASTGSNFDALFAGRKPDTTPTMSEIRIAIATTISGIEVGII